MTRYAFTPSPIGRLLLVAEDDGLSGLYMESHRAAPEPAADWRSDDAGLAEVRDQLEEYFAGRRQSFEVRAAAAGTPFQRAVWQALTRVPFGATVSYSELARRVGRPNVARAVGAAVGRNPVCVIVPCHRIVGTSGALTGYAGGLAVKTWLLNHERI